MTSASRHCIRLKDVTVTPAGLSPAGFRILAAIDHLAQLFLIDMVATSIVRASSTVHQRGEAVDISVRDWPEWRVMAVWTTLRSSLGTDFAVLYEVPALPDQGILRDIAYHNPSATAPHLHIQLRKGFGVWPPHANS